MARNKNESPKPRSPHRRGPSRPRAGASKRSIPLHKRSTSHFHAKDREHGSKCFEEGRVQLEVEGTRARARVRDTDRLSYSVGLDWSRVPENRALHAYCECQRFADGKPCRHLWATLLAVAESGPENTPPGKDRVGLRKDALSRWPDLGLSPGQRRPSPGGGMGPGHADSPPRRKDRDRAAATGRAPTTGRAATGRAPATGRAATGRAAKGRAAKGRAPTGLAARNKEPVWRSQLDNLRGEVERIVNAEQEAPPSSSSLASRGLRFLVDISASGGSKGLILDLFASRPGTFQRARVEASELEELLRPPASVGGESYDPVAVLTALPLAPPKGRPVRGRKAPVQGDKATVRRLRLPPSLYKSILPYLCDEEVLGWWDGRTRSEMHALVWDSGPAWKIALHLEVTGRTAQLHAKIERVGESVPLSEPLLIVPSAENNEADSAAAPPASPSGGAAGQGVVLFEDTVAPFESGARDLPWIELFREEGEISIPKEDLAEALTALFEIPGLPNVEPPDELQLTEERTTFQPRLVLAPSAAAAAHLPAAHLPLLAQLSFIYGDVTASAEDPRPAFIDWEKHTFLRRDMEGEHAALVRMLEAGVRPVSYGHEHELELSPQDLPDVAEVLLAEGWDIEVRGTSVRPPNPPSLRVQSGIDWFELSGSTDFAGDIVELKAILDAISRGDRFVSLSDGSQGLLPASWMDTYTSLTQLAQDATETGLRFLPSQALLVDAQLALMPPLDVDRAFSDLRKKLRSFESIKPRKEPRGFKGVLREYQRDGLGWLDFLREFSLGGILADDMGLGKTVQVLALMKRYRTPSKTTGLPWLVVAPRSLVYNWVEEAARFLPSLRVAEYRGVDRVAMREDFGEYDVVVTTYATLRLDIDFLVKVEFDTVVLDEAQAIKNRDSQAAKASRLLVARNRLALTGTPVENHLGELGSIFEFLNPGLLGNMPLLDVLRGGTASREEIARAAEGLRPFILRRTKAQVLKDLPPKTEQVLYVTLRPEQRELYDKVRAGYQASLLDEIEKKGVGRSAIQVLEALLRLRQVACHPGLVNPDWESAGSAKLAALFEQMSEVVSEGHKLIVFSQFTKLLAYVRAHLDEQGEPYAYLDGQTRNRGEVVDRFQTDPECSLFLISLKAGGVGLNLTAAGYVFLLDPWWNPAVEAQAVDRAHRIGQTQPVFSYRLIARDTVEEKILDLQHSKRKLADAILEGEGQTLRDLTADDLRMLLS